MRHLLILFSLIYSHLACQQPPPPDRPVLSDSAFDKELVGLLRFDVPLISVEALSNTSDSVLLLDSRGLEEYELSHLPQAHYAGYGAFELSEWMEYDKEQLIVVYCSVGYRSERIGRKLREKGFKRVYNLYGSIFEWVNQGLPIVRMDGKTSDEVHTYNKKWSRWVNNPQVQKKW